MIKFFAAILFSFILLGVLISFVLGPEDSCLDGGGCWDSVAETCRKDEPNAQLLCNRSILDKCDAETSCQRGYTCATHSDLSNAVCVHTESICSYFCPGSECDIQESYPAQIVCR